MVYPGARHSRFEHCIGACHVGRGIADAINEGEGEPILNVTRIGAAALCHDLGHGPFSHVSDFVYEKLTGRRHIHEQISAGIVRHHRPIRDALGDEVAEWVAQLLEGSGHGMNRSVERDIVAGPADVDKLDYLLRDSHYCGVNYGRFDLHKVIESARRASDPAGSLLAFHKDGIYAVEELLLARHHMHRQVYGHKTRLATDQMLIRSITLGVEEDLLPSDVFAPPEVIGPEYVNEYLAWDDYTVVDRLARAEPSRAGQVMRALVDRRLLRRSIEITFNDLIQVASRRVAGEALLPSSLSADAAGTAEETIAKAAGVDPLWVSLDRENLQSPLGSAGAVNPEYKQVYLVDDEGHMETLEEASEIFGYPGTGGIQRVVVYLRPDTEWDAAARQTLKEAALAAVVNIAEGALRPSGGSNDTA